MVIKKHTSIGPLLQGHEFEIANEDLSAATENEYQFTVQSDTVLFSLQASVISGTLDVVVYTEGNSEDTVGNRTPVVTFPTLSAPTSELILKKAASTMAKVRVVITTTGAATFILRARGISVGETTVRLAGSTAADNYGVLIDSTPRLLIPVALVDQNGISIVNNNPANGGTLYVGFKSSITTGSTASVGSRDTDAATPVPPGGSIGLDVSAGLTVYGLSDGPDIDVRVLQLGG
jgi:hypothetical protein